MDLKTISRKLSSRKAEFAERFGITELGVFGSYARGEQRKGSDIDILVEFSKTPSLFGLVEAEEYIGNILGAKVDLVTKDSLKNPYISRSILAEVVMI